MRKSCVIERGRVMMMMMKILTSENKLRYRTVMGNDDDETQEEN